MPSPQRVQPLWTLSALTIPEREEFLARLLASLDATVMPANTQVDIVYNSDVREGRFEIEKRIQAMAKKLPVTVHFTGGEVSIASGRALQLNSCKTPLVAFVDDDVTLHDDVLSAIERTMRDVPLGLGCASPTT